MNSTIRKTAGAALLVLAAFGFSIGETPHDSTTVEAVGDLGGGGAGAPPCRQPGWVARPQCQVPATRYGHAGGGGRSW
jgi:hypothetical protein